MELEPRSMEEIGAILRQIREEKQITLKELSEMTGLTVNRIKKFEESISDMPMTGFVRVCKALGIENPDDIIYTTK